MLVVVDGLLVAGPVLIVCCLAEVGGGDCHDVEVEELHVVLGLLAELQLIPASRGTR